MNKFEQLIEYVINDEEQKAHELFHDIVVAKSREIYENIMAEEAEEELDEAKDEEELDEAADEELDEAKDEEELDEAEEMEEGAMGGDASDDLIDEVETEEQSDMNMEGEGDDEEEEEEPEPPQEDEDEPKKSKKPVIMPPVAPLLVGRPEPSVRDTMIELKTSALI